MITMRMQERLETSYAGRLMVIWAEVGGQDGGGGYGLS